MTQTPEPDIAPSVDGPAHPAPEASPPVPDAGADATPESATSAVDDVVAQVRERGFITTGEIFAAFPDLEHDADELRNIWEMFESRGVKVLDEIAEELKLEDERRGSSPFRAPAPPARRAEHRPNPTSRPGAASRGVSYDEPDPDLVSVRAAARPTHSESGGSFDPVRMYLKEIG